MNYRSHLIVGFIAGAIYILFSYYFLGFFHGPNDILLTIVVTVIFSLLPDIDHRNSLISFAFMGMGISGAVAGYLLDNNTLLLSSLVFLVIIFISWNMGHRKFIHSISFGIIVSLMLTYFLGYEYGILGFICFYSHLLADKEPFKLI